MRARNIKPGFFANEALGELPPTVRLLFIGLWCLADREGRLEDRPKRIKAALFPYDNISVGPMLDKLVAQRFITRYNVGPNDYIEVAKFKVHQNPHPNERPSQIPAPNDIASTRVIGCSTRADSLIPDSLIPDSKHMSKLPLDRFDDFWKLYPRKEGKGQAEVAWRKATEKTSAPEIITGLQRQLPLLVEKERRFRKMPSTWLNGRCWEDEIDGDTKSPARIFTPTEEQEITHALTLYGKQTWEQAQDACSTDEIWLEVRRRGGKL